MAGRLAADSNVSVLLLEAGGDDDVPEVTEAGRWPMNLGSERDWSFQSQPNEDLNGRSIHLAMGKYGRLKSAWDEIKKSRATILFRGDVPADGKGFFFPVTILANPPEDASFITHEIFGPIRSVFKYKTVDEAIRRANDTSY